MEGLNYWQSEGLNYGSQGLNYWVRIRRRKGGLRRSELQSEGLSYLPLMLTIEQEGTLGGVLTLMLTRMPLHNRYYHLLTQLIQQLPHRHYLA